MKFVFRFDNLLNLAVHDEKEVKAKLAQKDFQIAQMSDRINEIAGKTEQAIEESRIDMQAGMMDKVRMYPIYLACLGKEKQFYEDEKARLEAQREKILLELNDKRRVRKTYEKIRERDEAAWKKGIQKAEQKALDEFGSRIGRGSANPDSQEGLI